MPIAEHGDEELKERVLPRLASGEWVGANAITEADAGSDVFALSCRAVRDRDRYLLTGAKTYVTNGPVADCFLVYASTEPAHGYLGISAFVVERGTPGLSCGDHFDKVGLTGAPVCEIRMEECPVDAGNRVGPAGSGGAIFRSSMDGSVRACSRSTSASWIGSSRRSSRSPSAGGSSARRSAAIRRSRTGLRT